MAGSLIVGLHVTPSPEGRRLTPIVDDCSGTALRVCDLRLDMRPAVRDTASMLRYAALHRLSSRVLLTGACLAVCLFSTIASADVYKWLDREGRTHYTDRPPPAEGKLISVARSGRPAMAEEPQAPTAPAAPAATPLPPADPSTLARLRAGVASDIAKRDAAACQAAQERYRQYVGARHLYRTAEDGTRTYLSDAEIEAERLAARREVEEFCGPSP